MRKDYEFVSITNKRLSSYKKKEEIEESEQKLMRFSNFFP